MRQVSDELSTRPEETALFYTERDLGSTIKHRRDRSIIENLTNGTREQWRNGKNLESGEAFLIRNRQGIGHDHGVNRGRLQNLAGRI